MAVNDALLNIGAAAMQGAAAYASLHTAQPDASGSNESAAARQAITWETAASGDMVVLDDIAFTGGAASGACTHIGFWSASTAGTFYGWLALTGDQAFNAAGEYTVTGVSIPGTAT